MFLLGVLVDCIGMMFDVLQMNLPKVTVIVMDQRQSKGEMMRISSRVWPMLTGGWLWMKIGLPCLMEFGCQNPKCQREAQVTRKVDT